VHLLLRFADVVEAALKARAELEPHVGKARQAVIGATSNARRARGALLLARLAGTAVNMGRALRSSLAAAAAQRIAEQEAAAVIESAALRRWQQQQQQQRRSRGSSPSNSSSSSSSQPRASSA
jgi:hypothetical protein